MKPSIIPLEGNRLPDSIAVIDNPQPFRYGLPKNFRTKFKRGQLMGAGECNSRGLRHGEWFELRQGRVLSIANYCNGKRHGLIKNYDNIGHLTEVSQFKEGKSQTRLVFYRTGWLSSILEFDEKERPLLQEFFYEGGRIKIREPFRNGQLHGVYQEWNGRDTHHSKARYVRGRRNGFTTTYGVGKSRIRTHFRDNKRYGWEVHYDILGRITKKLRWKYGRQVKGSLKTYDYPE